MPAEYCSIGSDRVVRSLRGNIAPHMVPRQCGHEEEDVSRAALCVGSTGGFRGGVEPWRDRDGIVTLNAPTSFGVACRDANHLIHTPSISA